MTDAEKIAASQLLKVEKPKRYRPDGDGKLRDSLLASLDAVEPEQRLALALALAIDCLDILAKNSLSPSQTRMASAHADAARDLIPADVLDLLRNAKRRAIIQGETA